MGMMLQMHPGEAQGKLKPRQDAARAPFSAFQKRLGWRRLMAGVMDDGALEICRARKAQGSRYGQRAVGPHETSPRSFNPAQSIAGPKKAHIGSKPPVGRGIRAVPKGQLGLAGLWGRTLKRRQRPELVSFA